MQTLEILGAKVVYDEYHLASKPELQAYLEWEVIRNLIESFQGRVIIVLGGDGTMLHAIQTYYQDQMPFLGINFGSVGFLLNNRSDLDTVGVFKNKTYPLLEVEASFNGKNMKHIAFNEVQIKAASGTMVDLNVLIGGYSEVDVRGDGVLIAAPAGSTAYNRKAGWPVLWNDSGLFAITPIIADVWPITFSDQEEVIVTNNKNRHRELSVFADTTPLAKDINTDVAIRVRRHSQSVELLIADERVWRAKMLEIQGMMRVR